MRVPRDAHAVAKQAEDHQQNQSSGELHVGDSGTLKGDRRAGHGGWDEWVVVEHSALIYRSESTGGGAIGMVRLQIACKTVQNC